MRYKRTQLWHAQKKLKPKQAGMCNSRANRHSWTAWASPGSSHEGRASGHQPLWKKLWSLLLGSRAGMAGQEEWEKGGVRIPCSVGTARVFVGFFLCNKRTEAASGLWVDGYSRPSTAHRADAVQICDLGESGPKRAFWSLGGWGRTGPGVRGCNK